MLTLNIAHRGGAALYPENTLAAFRHAIALGCDGAELDVQLSADGVALVYHDFRLNPGYARDADGGWLDSTTPRLKDLPLSELQRFDIGRARPGSAYAAAHPMQAAMAGEKIPTLADVVTLAKSAPGFRLLVELKCDASPDSPDPVALADAALAAVEAADFLERAIFVGFDWRALVRVKQQQPNAKIWCTTDEHVEGSAALLQSIKNMGGEGWFPYFARLTPDAAALAREAGLETAVWTVNDADNMRDVMALGVEAICTDRPDVLADFINPQSRSGF